MSSVGRAGPVEADYRINSAIGLPRDVLSQFGQSSDFASHLQQLCGRQQQDGVMQCQQLLSEACGVFQRPVGGEAGFSVYGVQRGESGVQRDLLLQAGL